LNDICDGKPDFLFNLYDLKDKFFETFLEQKGVAQFTMDNPIESIVLEGSSGFEQVTINMGNFGHIHLSILEAEKLSEGLNKILENLKKM
jgi:hypothetical protein